MQPLRHVSRLARPAFLSLLALAAPGVARAQSTEQRIERLAESLAASAERIAAKVERHATMFADRMEREWSRRDRADWRRDRGDSPRGRGVLSDGVSAPSLDTVVAFSPDGTIDLSNVAGDIIVTGWDRREVRIQARSERGDLEYSISSSRITIEERGDEWRRGRRERRGDDGDTRFELSVPRGVRVVARSTSGDVTLRGTGGEVEANTMGGDVEVEDATRRIEIGTLSGDVTARRLKGNVEANSVSGSVELDDVDGDVRIESTSGDLSLTNTRAREIDASTTSGEIVFSGTIASDGRYEFHSHSGNIELTVPASTDARFSVETYSGEMGSDFPITLEPGRRSGSRGRRFEFTVGNAGARVVAETFSGNLDIRKR